MSKSLIKVSHYETNPALNLLHLAALYGQVQRAKVLIVRYGWPVNGRNRNEQTPLHIACSSGHLEMVKMLVTEHQAELNLRNKMNHTPLHKALQFGQTEIVNFLINNFDCNPLTILKRTGVKSMLHFACYQGHSELVNTLLTRYKLDPLSSDDDGNTLLHDAAWGGSETISKSLINEYKCPVESTNHSEQTPLHLACAGGHVQVVKMLIVVYKANVNAFDKYGDAPLHKAALSGHSKVLFYLINECSCNPNTKGNDGRTVLHYACHQGHIELVHALLTQCGPDLLSVSDDTGNTPLHFAALGGKERVVKLLITKYSCPLSCLNDNKETPLDIACSKGHLRVLRLLVIGLKADWIEGHMSNCDTPLQIVAWYGQTDIMNNFIEKISNAPSINVVFDYKQPLHSSFKTIEESRQEVDDSFDESDRSTPLYYISGWSSSLKTIEESSLEVGDSFDESDRSTLLHYLSGLSSGAYLLLTKYNWHINKINCNPEESLLLGCHMSIVRVFIVENFDPLEGSSYNPLIYEGAWSGQTETIERLINEFSSVDSPLTFDGRTILNFACLLGYTELTKIVLTKYSIYLWCAEDDIIPLHIAAWYGHAEVVRSLIDEFHCNPNTKGIQGRTILHHACHRGHLELVKTLLKNYKLDPLCIDNNGNTSLHLAVMSGRKTIVKVIITTCDKRIIDCRNIYDQSPLDIACSNGHFIIAKMFMIMYDTIVELNSIESFLHMAANHGDINTIINRFRYYIPNHTGRDGMTILHCACHRGHTELAEILLTKYYMLKVLSRDNNENTPLHYAALSGQENVVKLLVTRHGCPVDCRNGNKETPLHQACSNGHLTTVKMLVTEYKADLNACDKNNNLPLHKAAWCGHTDVITCLIDQFGCIPSIRGAEGATILHHACHQGHIELIEILLSFYTLDPSSVDDNGNTPLHHAVLGGKRHVAEVLITKYGCPVDCRNKSNQTPLHLACGSGHLDIFQMLISKFKADLNICDERDDTPLHIAALCGQTHIVTHLINEFNFDPDIKGNQGKTALHHACHQEHIELAETFLTVFKLDPMTADDSENTPLHVAAMHGRIKVVKLLIKKYNCPIDCRNNSKQTPLHLTCSNGHLDMVKVLVSEYKADLNARDENNDTPLHVAAFCGHTHIIYYAINEVNYNPRTQGKEGRTILHHACYQGHIDLVERLLTCHELDPSSVDDNGNTSLHLAAMGGREAIAKLLVMKYGCPVDCRNYVKQSPLHLACSNGHIHVVRTLLSECKADLYTRDINSHTPLHTAAFHGQIDIIDYLIYGFDCRLDVKGTNGSGVLHLACQGGHVEFIKQLLIVYKLHPMIIDDDGNTPLHYAALGGKDEVAKLLITKYGSPVNHPNNNNETPLHLASTKGHLTFIKTLVTELKANINTRDKNGDTPLQRAALSGEAEVTCCLILEFNCDCKVTGIQGRNLLHYACLNDHEVLARKLIDSFHISLISADDDGNSPLHISAMFGQNKCVHTLLHIYHAPVYLRNNSGKSALEVAGDVVTKNLITVYLIEEHDKIYYDYKSVQTLSKKKYSGAQRLTRVFVLGNVQSGKSTLIESLKRQGFFSSFNQVSEATVPPHTSGIIPSEYCDKTIGRVLYYDFAGDPEYYSSHSAIMSSVMQSEEGTNVCLIVVNFQKDSKYILEELGYWLSFISYHCIRMKQKEKCKVLTVGSHIDLITKSEAKRKFALVSEFTEKYLSHTSRVSIEVIKSKSDLIINCCKPRSSTCVYSTLNEIVRKTATFCLSVEAAILLGLLEKDFKNVITYKVQTLLSHIRETGVYLPNTADCLYPKVMELHSVGLLLAIESKSGKLEDYLLLLNIHKLTNEVHKLLFSKDSAQKLLSSTDPHSASMGILPQEYLNSILPEYISTEILVQLQYCQEFSHAEIKFDYSIIPTGNSNAPTLFYFPALCDTERKKNIKTPENYNYRIGWYLKCYGKFDYLPPRFLHVLLLRLAHSFALPAESDQPSTLSIEEDATTMIRQYNHRCTMWKNGIHWLMEEGVECFIENIDNSKGIVVITKSEEARKSTCTEMLFKIIREIRQAKEEFCGTITLQEYLMDSDDPTAFTNEDILFLTCDIARVLKEEKPFIISASGSGHTQLEAAKISHLTKYVQWDTENNKGTLAPIANQREDMSPATEEREITKLSEHNHSILYEKLSKHSAMWQEIGTYLGFLPCELQEIQARSTLHATAPKSLLSAMLAEWLQWAPGDQRGSTKCATLEGLRDTLNKAGLAQTAQSIMTLELTA